MVLSIVLRSTIRVLIQDPIPVDHRSTYRGVSTKWPMDLCQSIHNSYFHAMRAQNYICIFSHYSSTTAASIQNRLKILLHVPGGQRACTISRISICCGPNHRQKKHPISGVLSFALTLRSGGLGRSLLQIDSNAHYRRVQSQGRDWPKHRFVITQQHTTNLKLSHS